LEEVGIDGRILKLIKNKYCVMIGAEFN